jgi:pimeloyl-ACP methyl ester carboxylesterase
MGVTAELVQTRLGKIEMRRGPGGPGERLVYLHSANGEGEALPLLDALAERFEVVAPMFPGFGESEGISEIDDMEDAVFHLLDLWDRLDLGAPTVVGTSLGGWMAAELATRYPERLSRLVLVNPVGLYIRGAEIYDIFGSKPWDLADRLFADHGHPQYTLMKALEHIDPNELSFEVLKPTFQALAATARLGWDPYLHNPRLRKRLHRITVPTLVVRGAQDTLVPPAHAQAYADAIPGARLAEVEGAAHLLPLDQPDELARLVAELARS